MILQRLSKVIFPDTQNITEEAIQHYEKNPDELDLIINKEYFNSVFLWIIFLLGLFITSGARIIQYFYGSYFGEFVNSVVLDVISEIGIAIFGGAVVAYLIETFNKQQYQQNVKYRRQIKQILEERKKTKIS